MKNKTAIILGSLGLTAVASAATIDIDAANSGRLHLNGNAPDFDLVAGGSITVTTLFNAGNALLGDNPSNDEFLQIWSFVADAGFVADITLGQDVRLDFDSGFVNNGAPTLSTVVFLGFETNASLGVAEAEALAEGGGSSLGTFTFDEATNPAPLSFTIGNASLAGITAGQRIYVGLDNVSTNNGAADNFNPGAFTGPATLTTIPEPGSLALLGIAGLAFLRRKR